MLEKFLNRRVEILYTTHAHQWAVSGNVTNIDENFIELDNNQTINIKFVISIRIKE